MTSGISVSKSGVSFGKIYLTNIIKKHKTPFFLFSEQRIIDNYKALNKAFKRYYPKTKIYYSIKTNYEPQILKTLRRLGSYGEAASALEVMIAEKAGFSPSDIILDGPVWQEEDINYCIQRGINTFNVDSLDMLMRLTTQARRLRKKVRISFRIYPEIKMSILKTFIAEFISKFGIPLSQALGVYEKASKLDNIIPTTISTHIGSMITDPSYYEKTIDSLVKLAYQLKKIHNIKITEINIGGGFGIQSLNFYSIQNVILNKAGISHYDRAPSIDEFGRRIAGRFKRELLRKGLDDIILILEPGRFLVSDSGILITKVASVKNNWVFLDGGINLIPESIFFVRRGFIVANKIGLKSDREFNIAGPTLNTQDVLSERQKLSAISVGDIVLVLDAGAYSLSRSNQFTILRPEVLYITKDKKIKMLRKKEEPRDLIEKLLL